MGKLYFYPAMRLGDAAGLLTRYLYDVDFPSVGVVPADLVYDVTKASLATVHARYASVVPNRTERGGPAQEHALADRPGGVDQRPREADEPH